MVEVTYAVRDMPSKHNLKGWKELEDRFFLVQREYAHARYMKFIAPNRSHYLRRYPEAY
jgi:hypothetical protein